MLTTVTKHKKFDKNCWYKKSLLRVCCEVGKQNAIALQFSLFSSMKKTSNYTHAIRERSQCISFHPEIVYLTFIFRFQIRTKLIVRLWICISINVAVKKYGGKVCSPSDFSLDGSYRVFPKVFLLADPFCFRKISTYPQIHANVNIKCPDDRCPILIYIYIPEPILDGF